MIVAYARVVSSSPLGLSFCVGSVFDTRVDYHWLVEFTWPLISHHSDIRSSGTVWSSDHKYKYIKMHALIQTKRNRNRSGLYFEILEYMLGLFVQAKCSLILSFSSVIEEGTAELRLCSSLLRTAILIKISLTECSTFQN
jgi:hypothetical protein